MGMRMKDEKGENSKTWLKTILSGVIGAVLSAAILWLAVILQIRTQYKQDYDLNVANMVVDVLLARDPSLHPLLEDLLKRVKDDSLKVALGRKVLINPTVSDTIKKQIENVINREGTVTVGIQEKATFTVIRSPERRKREVEIFFISEDTFSLRYADKIQKAILYKGIAPILVPIQERWFDLDDWKPISKKPEIRFNNSNAKFADSMKSILDSIPNLGEFEMNNTTTGTPPYSILIIIPDQRK